MIPFQEFIAGWMSHRGALIALLDTVKDDQLDFTPWDGAMSFAKLTTHIVDSTGMFASIVKGEAPAAGAPSSFATVEELKRYVQTLTEQTKSDLESLTEEQLNRVVEFAGMKMPGIALLQTGKDHEIHHKGQLFTYARIIGVKELPFFVERP